METAERILLHNSSQNDTTDNFLRFFLPTVAGINVPLVLTNFIVFINTGILNSPSNLLYFNLVIMDLLNCIVGIMVSYQRNRVQHSNTLETAIYTIYYFAYNGRVLLVFGLCLIRVLWTEMSALSVIGQLKKISVGTVTTAYMIAFGYVVYRLYGIEKFHENEEKDPKLFTSGLTEAGELLIVGLIVSIILMSIYTQIRIRLNKSRLQNNSQYKRASKASLLITLIFAISYSYYAIHIAAKIYLLRIWGNEKRCPSRVNWIDIFVCDSLCLGVSFMCLQSLGNGLILLWQVFDRVYSCTVKRIECFCNKFSHPLTAYNDFIASSGVNYILQ